MKAHTVIASDALGSRRRVRASWRRSVYPIRVLMSALAARTLDVGLAAVLLAATAPLAAGLAVLARRRAGRVLTRQQRVGRYRAPFAALSFAGRGPLRGLPQLINVLRGDMSWIGPRALRPDDAAAVSVQDAARWDVRPGVVSLHRVKQGARIAHHSEGDDDRELVYTQSTARDAGLLARALPGLLMGRRSHRPVETLSILGVSIVNTTMDEAVSWLIARAGRDEPTSVAFVNPDCLNTAVGAPAYREALAHTTRVWPDGIGLHLACQMLGTPLKANVNGTDLFPHLCEAAAAGGRSLYLLGGKPGVAEAAARAMTARYPALRIAGTGHGYMDAIGERDAIAAINASGADMLLVGFGAPRQELWLQAHADALRVPVRMGVGGLFDYYSGRIPRAPQWMREAGLEWIWRLRQEPGRLWRRYVLGNPLFLYRVWRQSRVRTEEVRLRDDLGRRLAGRGALASLRRQRWRLKSQIWRLVIGATRAIKRAIDIAGATALVVILLPVFAGVALAVRLDSPGPVLFAQTRVGRWGRSFKMWKFRSMYRDAEARKAALAASNEMAGGVIFKMKRDPRITRVGRLIRKASIDELPQLWNVIRGDMSLVGPRPPVPSEVARYSPRDRRRLDGVPGITCLWQVSGRSDIPFPDQVRLDVQYLESQSLWLDLQLLIKTIPAVLFGRGAY